MRVVTSQKQKLSQKYALQKISKKTPTFRADMGCEKCIANAV